MYERSLNEAERILASDRDIIVAVKKVWSEVLKEGKKQEFEVPALPDFTAMLEGDPRFEFFPSHKSVTEDLEDPLVDTDASDEREMEQLGFFSGDRVKLRKVELTPQLLGNIIRTKVDRTMNALTKAWELRPDGDQETEDRLLEILARTQKLQHEVKKSFSEERMKRLETTLKKSQRPKGRKKGSAVNMHKATPAKTVSRKPAKRRTQERKK